MLPPRHRRDEIFSGQARFCLRQNRPDLKDKPLFAFPLGKLCIGFSLSKPLRAFDSLFSAVALLTAKPRSCKSPAQVRPFAKTKFRPDAKFRFAEFWPDLRGQPLFTLPFGKVLQRFSPLKRRCLLIHPFPPVVLLTAKPRSCKTSAHVRRFAETD